MLKILHCFFIVSSSNWLLSVVTNCFFFANNRTQLFVQTHSPPPSYPLIPLTSLTPFRKTLLSTSQHTGKTYSFNLSWNVTMPADDTNVNKNPISWRSIVQSSNSVLRKIFSWGKPKKCYRMFYASKYRMSRKKSLKKRILSCVVSWIAVPTPTPIIIPRVVLHATPNNPTQPGKFLKVFRSTNVLKHSTFCCIP